MSSVYGIIGAGIAGTSIAYHLSESTDEDIIIFEKNGVGNHTTNKSIAMVGTYGNHTKKLMKNYCYELYN